MFYSTTPKEMVVSKQIRCSFKCRDIYDYEVDVDIHNEVESADGMGRRECGFNKLG